MKRLLITVGFLVMYHEAVNSIPLADQQPEKTNRRLMSLRSNFKFAYNYLRDLEGNYCWIPQDFGGETYAGITRRYNPKWSGWAVIDANRSQLKWNFQHPIADSLATQFYKQMWNDHHFPMLQDSLTSAYIFETFVLGPSSVKVIQRSVNNMQNSNIKVDGIITPDLMNLVNKLDQRKFREHLRKKRCQFYYTISEKLHSVSDSGIVVQRKTQKVFLNGWLRRTNKINTLTSR